jgi:hypothetical protein
MWLLVHLLDRFIRNGVLRLIAADGSLHMFGGHGPGPTVTVRLHDPRLYKSYSSTLQTRIANGQDVEAPADLRKFLSIPRIWRTVAEIQKSDYLAHLKLLDGKRRAGMPEG